LFGFYETPARLDAKIAQVCPSLRGLLDKGVVEVQWQPPTDDLLDAYGERLLRIVQQRKVRRLFIDGLGAIQEAAGASPGRVVKFLTALMNEMRVLGVTTLYTLEIPDIMGPAIRSPIGDLSNLAENLILLRFVEVRSRLYRLVGPGQRLRPNAPRIHNQQSGADHRDQRRQRRANHDLLSPKGG
jgi:circadian clock protein KaiC